MALHVSSKLCAIGLVVALLITAFSTPPKFTSVNEAPVVKVPSTNIPDLETPYLVGGFDLARGQTPRPLAFEAIRRVVLRVSPAVHRVPAVDVMILPHSEVANPVDVGITPDVVVTMPDPAPVATVETTSDGQYLLKSTAYNSLENQTDSTPHITATGATTRFGIIAVSRDLLGDDLPYGSLVRLTDLGEYHNGRGSGKFQALLDAQGLFVVEDTMHARKQQQIDVWFQDYADAIDWGVRQVKVEVVQYGRQGPEYLVEAQSSASGTNQ